MSDFSELVKSKIENLVKECYGKDIGELTNYEYIGVITELNRVIVDWEDYSR